MTRTAADLTEPRYDWIASLAFWLCLFVASVLFASVTLAPRLAAHIELKQEYSANQVELVGMESRMQYLERVAEALKTDPHFAAEVARIDFDAARPGDERIAVDKSLSLSAPKYDPLPDEVETAPWYEPLARFLAKSAALRPLTLLVAGSLVIVAFTFFHDAPGDTESTKSAVQRKRLAAKQPRNAA